ncbi:MAG: hypothetical protein HZA50_03810 [Planctomycetes bacterium]|nr:hypothetical protein [Planctomycetota bacterium]
MKFQIFDPATGRPARIFNPHQPIVSGEIFIRRGGEKRSHPAKPLRSRDRLQISRLWEKRSYGRCFSPGAINVSLKIVGRIVSGSGFICRGASGILEHAD